MLDYYYLRVDSDSLKRHTIKSRERTLTITEGLTWWPSDSDSTLPVQGARVQSLAKKLRSCMPCSMTKNNNH